MYKVLTKYGQTAAFLLGVVVIAIFLISVFSGVSEFNMMSEEQQKESSIFDIGLYLAILLTIIAGIVAIIAGIFHTASDVRGSIKGIVGMVAIVIIFFIAYSTYSGDPAYLSETLREFEVSDGQSAIITGAILTAIGLAIIATLAFAISELLNFFR